MCIRDSIDVALAGPVVITALLAGGVLDAPGAVGNGPVSYTHLDVYKRQILYGATGDFYLGDFGVSQYAAAPDATLTSSGTARYAAPEQLTGQADPRSDLYSLGLVLYELTNHLSLIHI